MEQLDKHAKQGRAAVIGGREEGGSMDGAGRREKGFQFRQEREREL